MFQLKKIKKFLHSREEKFPHSREGWNLFRKKDKNSRESVDKEKKKIFCLIVLNVLFLFILSGCSRKQQKAMIIKSSVCTTQLEESVARMTHIPDAPFGFRLQAVIPDQNNEQNVQIVYYPVNGVTVDSAAVKKNY